MEITFGIITSGGADDFIQKNVDSIRTQVKCPYEIIIIGETGVYGDDVKNVLFNEEEGPKGWITRKKNIITRLASYDILVIMHDYYLLDENWYSGFEKYGTAFDVCITPVLNTDGTRFRDYLIFPNWLAQPFNQLTLLPYSFVPSNKMYKLMYLSGGYYVIKKWVAQEHPLREELFHNAGEDIIFSQDLADANIRIQCNPHSVVHLQRFKPKVFCINGIQEDLLDFFNSLHDDVIEEAFQYQKRRQREWLKATYGIDLCAGSQAQSKELSGSEKENVCG